MFLECSCGCKLTSSEQLNDADFKIAFALASSNSQKIVGLISWFAKVKQLDVSDADFNRAFVDYFSTWPDSFTAELDLLTNNARLKQLNPFNFLNFQLEILSQFITKLKRGKKPVHSSFVEL